MATSTLELLKNQMDEMDTKISEKKTFQSLEENKQYLIEVKNETESNYKQINDAASTLLQILKSKTDKI